MKLRCPYCKHLIEGKPKPNCPSCGKMMMMPKRLLRPDRKDIKRIKETIARDAARKKKELGLGEVGFVNRRSGILIAIALLSVAGILLVGQSKKPINTSGKVRTQGMIAEDNLGVLTIALNRFKEDIGRYPTTEETLRALINNPGITNWEKSYVDLIRNDPWKQPYIYESVHETNILLCIGRDKRRGTEDDIYAPPVTDHGRQWGALYKARQEADSLKGRQPDTL
jgi:general secretion pathway protein G